MRTVLHVLPHVGGGSETYLQLLDGIEGFRQERMELSAARTPLAAAPSIASRWPRMARRMRKAELVHVHGDTTAMLVLPLLWLSPAVWTTHGLHLLRRRHAVAPLVAAAMGRTAVTICTSQAEARELAEIAPNLQERLRVVPNGVPLPQALDPFVRAEARRELSLREDELGVLFLGQLEQRKRPLDAVAAVEMARARGAAITLLVAGDGPLLARVRERSEALVRGSTPAVRALGFRDDPWRLFAAADVFVLPSAREGHSFALLEAMAHGLAAVVADGPGNAEAVGDGGLVFPTGNCEALSQALQQLACDPQRRQALGAAARAYIARDFSPQRLRAGVREAYERALTGPGRAGAGASA
jgi:glycosyltransferase involved in cell wall biosynthesis